VGLARQPHPAPLLGLGPDPLGAARHPRTTDTIRRLRSGPVSALVVFFFSLLFSEIHADLQILFNSYLSNRNSKQQVFYMKFYQKNV
jgi:hypothetical protein